MVRRKTSRGYKSAARKEIKMTIIVKKRRKNIKQEERKEAIIKRKNVTEMV